MDSNIRGNLPIAAVGVVFMLLGLVTKSWFSASIGADIPGNVAGLSIDLNIGLRDLKLCSPLAGGCVTIEIGNAQITGVDGTPAYFKLGPLTYYLGLVTVVYVLVAAGFRQFREVDGPAKGAAGACVLMVILGLITMQSFPSEAGVPAQAAPSVSWSPFVFLVGALMAAVGVFPPKEDVTKPRSWTQSGPRASVPSAQFGIARDPAIVRPERLRTPAGGIELIELPADEPPKPVVPRERSGRSWVVSESGMDESEVDVQRGAERVRYASATARIDGAGISSTNHTGDVWRLDRQEIIAVVVRGLPPDETAPEENAANAFILDMVGDYIAGHLPRPLRIVRDTEVNFEVLPSGASREQYENLRNLVGFIRRANPDLQIDSHTQAFLDEGLPPKQFKLQVEFYQYDLRYGG